MSFGGLVALLGIILFVRMGTQGTSQVRMLGFEFHLGGSALVVFVLGVVVFLAPLIYGLVNHEGRNDPLRLTPLGWDGKYIITDKSDGLRPKVGLFDTLGQCAARVAQLADSWNYESCIAVPDVIWCYSTEERGLATDQSCYVIPQSCQASLRMEELEREAGGTRTAGCRRMSFEEAFGE